MTRRRSAIARRAPGQRQAMRQATESVDVRLQPVKISMARYEPDQDRCRHSVLLA